MSFDLPMNMVANQTRVGANPRPDGSWELLLWAPNARAVSVHLLSGNDEFLAMESLPRGYHSVVAKGLEPGMRYFYRLEDGRELPDPASRFQPEGVHGPSQLVDASAFQWSDRNWQGTPLEGSIFYELHVGTYTREGSFDALIGRLPEIATLGITTIELMPIGQFPGARNWGYDGAYPFAPQNTYGGPEGLQRLVNAAHIQGLSVALDVVYNHLGPEGNYLGAYGPYFTDRYRTPWGQAINFDAASSEEVRRFFIENALYWLEDYHFDALRLDAIHGIFDFGARHFLAELKSAIADLSTRLGRHINLIAESDLNDSRVLRSPEEGGYSIDAQWSDDFHHSLHALLTEEKMGYYADFGGVAPLAISLRQGWYYSGQYSEFRQRRHGNLPHGLPASRFVVCNQNHDQVGNRAAGERLNSLVCFEAMKLAAGTTLLSPLTPLLFMGEEYGETAPFQYFTSHEDPALVEAVRRGRREEFAAFGWAESVPDPQDEQTFLRSQLNHSLKAVRPHNTLLKFYQELIRIRKKHGLGTPASYTVHEPDDNALVLIRKDRGQQFATVFNFADFDVPLDLPQLAGHWTMVMHSADKLWGGPKTNFAPNLVLSASAELRLSPQSFLVIARMQSDAEAE
jgi:maltooligosyltrehalose trehalohydrolase